MPTVLNDAATSLIVQTTFAPAMYEATAAGDTVDLIDGDGGAFATIQVGQLDGSEVTVTGKVQESVNGTTWTDISGATFAEIDASDAIETISFRRSARYVRVHVTIAGTGPEVYLSAIIGQQRKLI